MHLHHSDFFEYERQAAAAVLGPLLRARPTFRYALDLGCGYGGVLKYLVDENIAERAAGVDHDDQMIAQGRARLKNLRGVSLHCDDLMRFEAAERADLVILRDVAEHMPDLDGLLSKASAWLAPGGTCFVSFAPFYSPFGGHQHCLRGWVSRLPYVQLLPLDLILRATEPATTAYKTGERVREDLSQVFRSRLTIRRFESALRRFPLETTYKGTYLVRPEFRLKYSLLPLANLPFPLWQELTSTGVYYLLRRKASS